MATAQRKAARKVAQLPPLQNGDRLDQPTFHARYKATREDVRAELIGGVVYMPSPQKKRHGRYQSEVIRWLHEYELNTPGTEVLINPTTILGPTGEPEPDACLLIHPDCGGQTREDAEGYVLGSPELIAEVSWSSESIDLNAKKWDYEKAGVREYVVVALRMKRVFWFIRRRGKFKEVAPAADGIYRSETFPGLWLDPTALLGRDPKQLLAVARQGLSSPEHETFTRRLGRR